MTQACKCCRQWTQRNIAYWKQQRPAAAQSIYRPAKSSQGLGYVGERGRAGAPGGVAEREGGWPGAPANDLIHVPAHACSAQLSFPHVKLM